MLGRSNDHRITEQTVGCYDSGPTFDNEKKHPIYVFGRAQYRVKLFKLAVSNFRRYDAVHIAKIWCRLHVRV